MRSRSTRRGFTLTELIVVIAIIGFLATLTALYFPRFQDREYVNRGTDSLQMWLIMAKQQARRDGQPTGLRFILEKDTSSKPLNQGKLFCRRIVYIQQPEDVAQGLYAGKWDEVTGMGARPATAYFSLPPGRSFGSAQLPVAVGDYIEFYGGGVVHKIKTVQASSLELIEGTAVLPGNPLADPLPMGVPPLYNNEPVNYRIIRQPQPIPGEQELVFPENIGIDFNLNNPANPDLDGMTRPMTRGFVGIRDPIVPPPAPPLPDYTTSCDIVFAPSGALVGSWTQNVQVRLWVRDLSRDNTGDLLAGHATLVSVQPRTGFIASHPAASGSDPYLFTKDAKSSGM